MNHTPTPAIVLTERKSGWSRYMIDGRCEITIYDGAPNQLCSFGGKVWPMEWPELFSWSDNLAHGVFLTDAGRAVLAKVQAPKKAAA